jgi:hypothetical protein
VGGVAKPVVDLTSGGACDLCGPSNACYVCKATGVALWYAQTGDHTHLVILEGKLGREAHGKLLCASHYADDFNQAYPSEPVPAFTNV